jgi:hypothetical protein
MNGVAQSFWKEMFDLHAPVTDDRREKRTGARRKKVRKLLTNTSRPLRRD